jgi:hypothetical protein
VPGSTLQAQCAHEVTEGGRIVLVEGPPGVQRFLLSGIALSNRPESVVDPSQAPQMTSKRPRRLLLDPSSEADRADWWR